ncbi:MAG: 16S rRNA (adenine(1518)-N(6)/adenine(1519)-N(6))-dimethyltransferase RsmA [Gemmatimonadales bacterium]|jgi:16S rRNA (adenine1518-N6/adenine1519-N6)-dimethyltransferase
MRAEAAEHRRAKRSLSQNFLVDRNLQKKILGELDAVPHDVVLEIGAGHGELGGRLAGRVAQVILVEKDDDLARELSDRFSGDPSVRVVHDDALEVDLSALIPAGRAYRVLSNLPYAITTPLLFRILDMRPAAERVVVTVQREVAERIVAGPGSKTYGALSVGVQVRGAARVAFRVGRNAFRPVPAVDSAVVVIDPDPGAPDAEEEAALRRLTRVVFGRRRKQLQKILRSAPEYRLSQQEVERLAATVGFDLRDRPETLDPGELRALACGLIRHVEKR